MTKQLIRRVHQIESYKIPVELDKFIEYIRNQVDAISVDKKDVSIEVCGQDCYGETEGLIILKYDELETDKEYAERLAREVYVKEYKRKQFEALKKEFGE